MPAVSVIVPNYNHASFLNKRIESILSQTYTDYEIIILDDHSTDSSFEVIKKYTEHPKVRKIIVNKRNSGSPFKQWKKGVEHARGEYIWIAESDDYADSNFLKKLFPVIDSDESIALVYSQSLDVNEEDVIIRSRIYWTENFSPNIWKHDFICGGNEFIEKYLAYKNVIPNASAVLFRKSVFLKRYDPASAKMKMIGDWLLWISVIKNNKVAFVSDPLNYFREHGSTSRVHDSQQKKITRLLEEANIINSISTIPGLSKSKISYLSEVNLRKWFRLFPSFTAILNKNFYRICKYHHIRPLSLICRKTLEIIIRYSVKLRNKLHS